MPCSAQPSRLTGTLRLNFARTCLRKRRADGVIIRMCPPVGPPPRLVSTSASGSPAAPLRGTATRLSAAEQQPVRSCCAAAGRYAALLRVGAMHACGDTDNMFLPFPIPHAVASHEHADYCGYSTQQTLCNRPVRLAGKGGHLAAAGMDDLERAILYSFDETGAVAPELKVLCRGRGAASRLSICNMRLWLQTTHTTHANTLW